MPASMALLHDLKRGIKTPRLLLRGAQEGDLYDLHTMLSDGEVMKYW